MIRDYRVAEIGSLRNSGFVRQLLLGARQGFQRIGVMHGEAWSLIELAVIAAGSGLPSQALALCEEAAALFASYDNRRGEDWARFLRCTLLPYASTGGAETGRQVALEDFSQLIRAAHPLRDSKLADCMPAFALLLQSEAELEAGLPAWRPGMIPSRRPREVKGAAVTDP
ncbi:hypothetical protein [Streptomyces sp. NRRL F-5755]|uniref:hypothetical protein n=1 Tax=Streptomyces sp. NRRL F-5755 TaxID=1519475 RepID=UPI000A9CA9A6|nr:hypothetical protein [Streptomyces sp. NRRL F-5755]